MDMWDYTKMVTHLLAALFVTAAKASFTAK